ncbi:MAG: hypothetical protein O8C59_02500, partial [Candidatus Methanoperedens sp.]|nr:hypothetical protein [Candidatus Methanoperedens sp.]
NGRWKQRYEYVMTNDGLEYTHIIAPAYQNELKIIEDYLVLNKHSIPRDIVSVASRRYRKEIFAGVFHPQER